MIGDVYRFRMNSVCVCGGERGLSAGKCTAWNCQDRNRVGGGSRVFGGGCTFGHESGNTYGGRGRKCEYGHISNFGGVAKTGPCVAFDVKVAGQETNTTQGVSSNSGVGTRVHLPFGAGIGTGTEMGAETNNLGVAGGLRVACSQGQT